MKEFEYFKPKTLEEGLALFAKYGGKAKWIAGGTDVIVMIRQKTMVPDVLISLRGIPGLDQIKFNGSLNIGPMVTHRAIEKSEIIRKNFSALADAVDYLGSVQIRNVATIGGNICTAAPSADTVTPLLVLGTQVRITSRKEERILPIEEFFKGPGETVLKPGDIAPPAPGIRDRCCSPGSSVASARLGGPGPSRSGTGRRCTGIRSTADRPRW